MHMTGKGEVGVRWEMGDYARRTKVGEKRL